VTLGALSKSHVPMVWPDVREHLRSAVGGKDTVVVWDPQVRLTHIATEAVALREAVCHGRPVHVLPLGAFVTETRRVYRVEVDARRGAERAEAPVPRALSRRPGGGGDDDCSAAPGGGRR
jgi:hypothetical protein